MQRGSGEARGGGMGLWESFGGGVGWDGGEGGLFNESERGGEVESWCGFTFNCGKDDVRMTF